MRRVSVKRQAANRERAKMLAEKPRECSVEKMKRQRSDMQKWPECGGQLDGHELLSRARGGSITDPENVVMICRNDHRYLTDHPAEAERLGLAKRRWNK